MITASYRTDGRLTIENGFEIKEELNAMNFRFDRTTSLWKLTLTNLDQAIEVFQKLINLNVEMNDQIVAAMQSVSKYGERGKLHAEVVLKLYS